jgi:hypothetical protein
MKGTTMIDTTPEFIAMQDAPAKQRKIGLYLLVMSVVLMFIALGTYTFHQHQILGQSQKHAASVSSQLTSTKKDLAAAKSDNADLTSQNQTLSDTAAKCSVYPAVTRHMSNAMTYELKAVTGGTWGSIIWLPKATSEMHKVTSILDSHQSYDGELQDVCGPSSGLGA